jgi:sec-independent protein translocase protein TatC
VIAVIAALATPTADPMSMFLVMIPLVALYFIAAAITYFNDKLRARRLAKEYAGYETLAEPESAVEQND